MNELRLPPRRPLPPEVRSRLRTRVRAGVRGPNQTRFGRAPYAVAAGVAVLAAGAMIVAQSVRGNTGTPGQRTVPPTGSSTANRPLDVRQANAELDRCWAAVQAEGKADQYPDRSRWRAVSAGGYLWVSITAAIADSKPIFCQTSVTTVRVSQPTATPGYAPGSRTAALLVTPEGIIAGVRDESWAGVGVFTGDGSSSSGSTAERLPYGLFVVTAQGRLTDATQIEVDRWANDRDRAEHPERLSLARPLHPVSRVDRPAPAADRTSERGQWVATCLSNSHIPVADPDMWQPGAWVTVAGGRYMVLRAGQEFAYCFQDTIPSTKAGLPDTTRWAFSKSVGGVNETGKLSPVPLPSPDALQTPSGEKKIITGAQSAAVAQLEIILDGQQPVQADVYNSTFVAVITEELGPRDRVRAFDAAGNVIHEGPLF